jgi:hypothetical protein
MSTNLELEALNLVNEEIMGPEVTDEEKYRLILEKRKGRRAVCLIFNNIYFYILGRKFI